MLRKGNLAVVLAVALGLMFSGAVWANGPELMVYSGIIPQGVNQGDGSYDVTFSIYPTQAGGMALWTETQSVYVYRGTFAVWLGAVNRLNLGFEAPYWVGVKAGGREEIWPLMAGYAMPASPATGGGASPQAVVADEVLSANIKEADNISGQNTSTGSGVKTGHIANSAVTAIKIAPNAIISAKIKDGAVTDAKLTGPIGTGKLNVGTAAGTVAAGDHGHDYDAAYVNVAGDTMTGALKLPADGLTVGTNQLTLSGGNVGIGTSTPAAKLGINGGVYIVGSLGFNRNPDDGSVPPGGNPAGGRYQLTPASNRLQIESYTSAGASSGLITMDPATGNVGIGGAPASGSRLDVFGGVSLVSGGGSGNWQMTNFGSDAGPPWFGYFSGQPYDAEFGLIDTQNATSGKAAVLVAGANTDVDLILDGRLGVLNKLVVGYDGGTLFADPATGKVGMGTTSPSNKLTVAGVIESTAGGIKFPDGTVQATAAKPTWGQVIAGAERWQSVLGGTAALDRETGLVWQRATDGQIKDYYGAMTYCYKLGLGNRRGWRAPTIEELTSLVDMSVGAAPYLPSGHPFTDALGILSSFYWSSTTNAGNPGYAWNVSFYSGYVYYNVESYNYYVRCVRGGQ